MPMESVVESNAFVWHIVHNRELLSNTLSESVEMLFESNKAVLLWVVSAFKTVCRSRLLVFLILATHDSPWACP
jgi:alpha-galactosidase/6-phospho-beta-glucosidase family protein